MTATSDGGGIAPKLRSMATPSREAPGTRRRGGRGAMATEFVTLNVFGVRGLGVDVRVGWLFPGRAFRRNVGNEDEPAFRDADLGFSLVAKALF